MNVVRFVLSYRVFGFFGSLRFVSLWMYSTNYVLYLIGCVGFMGLFDDAMRDAIHSAIRRGVVAVQLQPYQTDGQGLFGQIVILHRVTFGPPEILRWPCVADGRGREHRKEIVRNMMIGPFVGETKRPRED